MDKIDDSLYDKFDIKLKESIHKLSMNEIDDVYRITCSTCLKDGRFATGSEGNIIIIYNSKTFEPELIIEEHDDTVCSIKGLSSGILASCSDDHTVKFFDIKNNSYKIIQSLEDHKRGVYGIAELNNKGLVSCSSDKSIIFYSLKNDKYIKDYQYEADGHCWNIIQTKENEICFSEEEDSSHSICFYDLFQRKILSKINNIKVSFLNCFYMITEDLLLINGNQTLSIINVNQHDLVRIINVSDSDAILSCCMLNKYILLTGDGSHKIKQWKIEGDNLNLISIKENAHTDGIFTLLKIGEGHVLSGSRGEIKIW